jgi:hypothetical protein
MPDFFERLAARSAGRPGVRAMPRLAHPFERAGVHEPEVAEVPAVRPTPLATAGAPAVPSLPSVVERHTETVHHERELLRSTVVERNAITVQSSMHHVLERLEVPQQPLLVPVPVVAPVADLSQPSEPAVASPAAPPPAPAVAQPVRVWAAVAKTEQAVVPGRRAAPEPERVVHVSIGRVEVKAAAPPAGVPKRAGRPAPAVPLEKYLAREGS